MKESLRLLSKREYKVVIGRYGANLWLLVVVMVVTFLSIAFSNASMIFLNDKMNDPFTNWVNIDLENNIDNLRSLQTTFDDDDLKVHYGIKDYQTDMAFHQDVFSSDLSDSHYLSCRFIENLSSDLVQAIMSSENLVSDSAISMQNINAESLGVIITWDNLKTMGYSLDNLPAYIMYKGYSINADTLGVRLYNEKFAPVPLPVLAVVKRLPMNFDMVAPLYLYNQIENPNHPFDFNNRDYQKQLIYHVDDADAGYFEKSVVNALPPNLKSKALIVPCDEQMSKMASWKKGRFFSVYPIGYDVVDGLQPYQQAAKVIDEFFKGKGVTRVYDYATTDYDPGIRKYLSLNFSSLDSIRPFENYMKQEHKIQIEMSQVNAKENFNAVSIMASVLSWAMILFSIVCIILFIINMLQSYFQKVKRNIGTFKAFGISTSELTMVYMLIILLIVSGAIILALSIAYITEISMQLFGLLKEGRYCYLSLWSVKTMLSIIIMILSTIITVLVSLRSLLHKTPGDLIYDR